MQKLAWLKTVPPTPEEITAYAHRLKDVVTAGGGEGAVDANGSTLYVPRHDPFVYFQSITGDASYCNTHVVPLGSVTGATPAVRPRSTERMKDNDRE